MPKTTAGATSVVYSMGILFSLHQLLSQCVCIMEVDMRLVTVDVDDAATGLCVRV